MNGASTDSTSNQVSTEQSHNTTGQYKALRLVTVSLRGMKGASTDSTSNQVSTEQSHNTTGQYKALYGWSLFPAEE
jgi:hypothetical protein